MKNTESKGLIKELLSEENTLEEKYLKARESFWEYCKLMNPKFFQESRWHLKEIAETLQALYEDRILKISEEDIFKIYSKEEKKELNFFIVCEKMMLNIPPRHGKSYTLALFEQWLLGKDNGNTIITVSYNETLAGRFSSNVRDGIDATKIDQKLNIFSDIFPKTKIKYGDAAKSIWALENRFFSYLGTAFGGTITGVGCKIGVIDDPVKNDKEAFNDRVLEEQWSWYADTFLSRIEEGGKQIINMTRWSTKDLCGRLLESEESEEWYVLLYPACLNEKEVEQDPTGKTEGKMLCPELMSFKKWKSKKKITSPAIFAANYQQTPVDVQGALYSQGFKTYDVVDNSQFQRILNYTDTADEGADFLCSISGGVIDKYGYVTDIYYTDDGMEVTEKETARRLKENGVREVAIESNNGGRGFARNVEAWLKKWKWTRCAVQWFHQSQNKKARILSKSTNVLEQIIMPDGWEKKYPEFYKAIISYQRKGKNPHDDAPDALTGFVELINGEVKVKRKAKVLKRKQFKL